jgi:hypothetical protein
MSCSLVENIKNAVFWDMKIQFLLHRKHMNRVFTEQISHHLRGSEVTS